MRTLTQKQLSTRTWQIDAAHTNVEFAVRHLMISTVRGRFGQVEGIVELDETLPVLVAVQVTIPVASIDTRNDQRDAHLRSADFFDVERYPTITFGGRRIIGDLKGDFQLEGELTIRGTTRPIVLQITSEGRGLDPWGNEKAGFSATARIDRRDFGLTYNQALEAGGVVVGNEVKISLDVELQRPALAETLAA